MRRAFEYSTLLGQQQFSIMKHVQKVQKIGVTQKKKPSKM